MATVTKLNSGTISPQRLSATSRAKCLRRVGTQCVVLALFVSAIMGGTTLQAQNSSPTEYQVKAAYLYNFGKFVEWPSTPKAANNVFGICVLGQDPFGTTFDTTIAGESVNTK